jgi:LysM repeat protein
MTPPKDSVRIRIPLGAAEGFADALAELPADDRVAFRKVESKKGEALSTIARRAGIPTKQLASFNPDLQRLKSGNLATGQRVLIPTAAVLAAATNAPDPSIERYGSTRGATHVIRSGETLGGIAKRYHMTTAALMQLNGLRRPLIHPGQTLVVRGGKRAKKAS